MTSKSLSPAKIVSQCPSLDLQVFTFEKEAAQEPEGFMDAMIAAFNGPSPLIEWLGSNKSDADREDVRDKFNGM